MIRFLAILSAVLLALTVPLAMNNRSPQGVLWTLEAMMRDAGHDDWGQSWGTSQDFDYRQPIERLFVDGRDYVAIRRARAQTEYPQADANSYTPTYVEPVIESSDSCAAGYTCHTLEACDVTYTTSDDLSTDIVWSNDTICITEGDYRADGEITTGASGTSGDYKQVRCVTSGGDRASADYDNGSDGCVIRGITIDDDYIVFDRIKAITNASVNAEAFHTETASQNIVLNEVYANCEFFHSSRSNCVSIEGDDTILQYSKVEDTTRNEGEDDHCIGVSAADDVWITSNEISGCTAGIQFQVGNAMENARVENNDVWTPLKHRQDCTGDWPSNQNNDGDCACTEGNGIVFKEAADNTGTRALVVHNRLWGSRGQGRDNDVDGGYDCGGTGAVDGGLLSMSDDAGWVVFERNILMDFQSGIEFGPYDQNCPGTENCGNVTMRANLFYGQVSGSIDVNTSADAFAMQWSTNASNSEDLIVFNSFIDGEDHAGVEYIEEDSGLDYEGLCNLALDAQNIRTDSGAPGGGGQYGYWVYGGDTEAPAGSNNVSTLTAADMVNYTLQRRLLTGPEEVVLENVVPLTTSPAAGVCSGVTFTAGYGAE